MCHVHKSCCACVEWGFINPSQTSNLALSLGSRAPCNFLSCTKPRQVEEGTTLPGVSSLGAWGCSVPWGAHRLGLPLRVPLAHSQGSRRRRRRDAESPLTAGWGREGRELGFMQPPAVRAGSFIACCFMVSHRRSAWGRGETQNLKREGFAGVLQSDFLNYSGRGILPHNSHNAANNFVTELGKCEGI